MEPSRGLILTSSHIWTRASFWRGSAPGLKFKAPSRLRTGTPVMLDFCNKSSNGLKFTGFWKGSKKEAVSLFPRSLSQSESTSVMNLSKKKAETITVTTGLVSLECVQHFLALRVGRSHTMKVYTSIVASSITFSLCMWSFPVSVDGKPTHCRKREVASASLGYLTERTFWLQHLTALCPSLQNLLNFDLFFTLQQQITHAICYWYQKTYVKMSQCFFFFFKKPLQIKI